MNLGQNLVNLGQHILAEFFNCNSNVLNNPELVETMMKEAAEACGATIVQSCFHRFNPYGVSGVVVIAESHLAIHTWPEHGYASVDLYTCGPHCSPQVAMDYLKTKLLAAEVHLTELHRGFVDKENRLAPAAPRTIRSESQGAPRSGSAHSGLSAPCNAALDEAQANGLEDERELEGAAS